ncbi:hypothetical protein [Sulfitobacter sabulilitoris]|uniref:Uncharacterized protein n=1 Tax=Sulfitobacter sabulilitoris TaxID=2562655 RepID=A0A5S3PBT1_9RHOB|nr:hypothetical protein [Sulfitobacter sabulilitoris]TMM51150.1 hypothetical protein FDT80_14890 [Sulfitobacter sabulilitoris]
MSNSDVAQSETDRQEQVNARALASIHAQRVRRSARGYAVMSGALGFGEGVNGSGLMAKISHGAKLFCIGFALLVPSLLVWQVLLD